MNYIPLGKRVIVAKPAAPTENKTASGIILVTDAKPENEAKVVAVGDEVTKIKVGEIVVYPEYGLIEITDDDIEYYVINEEDILLKRISKKK